MISGFVGKDALDDFHDERSDEALRSVREGLQQAGVPSKEHEMVGSTGAELAELARNQGCELSLMGTRGLSASMCALLGSATQDTIEHVGVPVMVVK